MTRGEAFVAIEAGGYRVKAIYQGCIVTFWVNKSRTLETDYDGLYHSVIEVFYYARDYEVFPEPDTAEKILRDVNRHIDDSDFPRFVWPADKGYEFAARVKALIAQMDGEK